jgi:uncharacterized protein (DUF1810 family)
MSQNNLQRFIDAQERDHEKAFSEIKSGRKRTHWIWYIFPQVAGLGFSDTSKYYAIRDSEEAKEFATHPLLASRLVAISQALLDLGTNDARQVMGSPDDLKLRSSMTLFAALPGANPVFEQVLQKFFGGTKDDKTIAILNRQAK